MTVGYRNRMNFTLSALRAAEKALTALRDRASAWQADAASNGAGGDEAAAQDAAAWNGRFWERLDDDLDLPGGLAALWRMAKSRRCRRGRSSRCWRSGTPRWAWTCGGRRRARRRRAGVGAELARREGLRQRNSYPDADAIRADVASRGVRGERHAGGGRGRGSRRRSSGRRRRSRRCLRRGRWRRCWDRAPECEYSLALVASDYLDDVKRCAESALRWAAGALGGAGRRR